MSTIQSVKRQLRLLIDQANNTTKRSDENLTLCQQALIVGYGTGSGEIPAPNAKTYYFGASKVELSTSLFRLSSTATSVQEGV